MATNVSEKDKTLNEIIDYCDRLANASKSRGAIMREYGTDDILMSHFREGQEWAWKSVSAHCKKMLGYSGSMPSEVPNQSEDAK